MATKRKPLDDARRRVQEKLSAIDEQKAFIQNSVEQIASGVKSAASSLLKESNKTKFFQKYRAVSQELEKCLDDLLVISATVSSLEDEEEEENDESEEDEKLPSNQLESPDTSQNGYRLVDNNPVARKKTAKFSSGDSDTSLPEQKEPSQRSSPNYLLKSEDLIYFESQSPNLNLNSCEKGVKDFIQNLPNIIDQPIGQEANLSVSPSFLGTANNVFESTPDTSLSKTVLTEKDAFACSLVEISGSNSEKTQNTKDEVTDNDNSSPIEKSQKQVVVDDLQDSNLYVNGLFMSSPPPLSLPSVIEPVKSCVRRNSLGEESGKILHSSAKNEDDLSECGSPNSMRLERIGFCAYTTQNQATFQFGAGASNEGKEPILLVNEFESKENDEAISDVSETGKPKISSSTSSTDEATKNLIEECQKAISKRDHAKVTANEGDMNKVTSNNIENCNTMATNAIVAEATVKHAECFTKERKIEHDDHDKTRLELNSCGTPTMISNQLTKAEMTVSIQNDGFGIDVEAIQDVVPSATKKVDASSTVGGEVIKDALRDPHRSSQLKRLQIPDFAIPKENSMKVIVKEIVSPKDFWIQIANDYLDLLMQEMCVHFSKRAKAGDKGGLKELPDVGHVCCGRYTVDNVWYRALVLSHEDNCAVVLYVDEGNSETLPLSRLRGLDEKFAALPCQALRVRLRDLQFSEDTNLDEVNDWFKRRVSGEILEAVVDESNIGLTPVPLDLYICPHSRLANNSDFQKLEYNLTEMLIRRGLAVRAASPRSTVASDDVSPPSSPSDQVLKSESVVCSTASSGFHDASSRILEINTSDTCSSIPRSSPGCQGDAVVARVPPPPHIPVDLDGSVYLLVSHVVSPSEFYVHFITTEAGMLDNLMTEMNQVYEDLELEDSRNFSPRIGEFCCARFSVDGNWYRGLVLNVRNSGVQSSTTCATVNVFYIDFGNIELVNAGDIRELLPQFVLLPAQVARCSLADVNPSIKPDLHASVFDDDMTMEQDDDTKPRLSWRRSRKNKTVPNTKAITVAAGDENSEDECPTGDLNLRELILDPEKLNRKNQLRTSISEEIAKNHAEPSVFSDTSVELFDSIWSDVQAVTLKPEWSDDATGYFKSLTINAQKLVGYIVPWDSNMMNTVVNYSQGTEGGLPNLGPVLSLNLYDVSGDYEVFINAEMVRSGYGSSYSIKVDQFG